MENNHVLVVTTNTEYLIPVDERGLTFNGWSIEQLIEDWFGKVNTGSYHATRDSCWKLRPPTFISHKLIPLEKYVISPTKKELERICDLAFPY